MKLTLPSGAAVLGAVWVLGLAQPTRAIPAFARKYHTTCARCHSEVPRLNNYGWNFKMRGFHVPGDEDLGKISMPEDPRLELMDQYPLAVRVTGNMRHSSAVGGRPDVSADNKMELLSGGNPGHNMAYFLELEAEKEDSGGFSTGIGNARFMFRDLLKSDPIALNLEFGKFNLDEFGVSNGRSLTRNPYAIYDVSDAVGNFPFADEVMGLNFYGAFGTGIGKAVASAAPAEGKAAAVSEAEQKALDAELAGAQAAPPPPDTPEMIAARAVLGALVSKGTLTQAEADSTLADLATKLGPPPAPPAPPPTEAAAPSAPLALAATDYDVRKGVFYQAGLVTRGRAGGNQGQGFGRLIYSNEHGWWVSPLAYFGSNDLSSAADPAATFTDHFRRYGLEAGFTGGPHRDVAGVPRKAVELLAAYQDGRDDNTDGGGMVVRHQGGFAEFDYLINDQNLAVLRWDRLRSQDLPQIDVNSLTLNYTHYLQRNLKVGLEYVPDLMGSSSTHVRDNVWTAFYDFAL